MVLGSVIGADVLHRPAIQAMKRNKPNSAIKVKKCKWCKSEFVPFSSFQKCCSRPCELAVFAKDEKRAIQKQQREKRKELKERKEKLKTLQELRKEADAAFNAYVRHRDYFKSCVCCPDKPLSLEPMTTGGQYDAGHFLPKGGLYSHLRYNLNNVHGQRKSCNAVKQPFQRERMEARYERHLRERIGDDKVDALKSDRRTIKRNREYYRRIRDIFRKKLARAKRRQ